MEAPSFLSPASCVVRDAAKLNDASGAGALTEAEPQKGMEEMSEKFRALGSEVYVAEE